MTLDGNQLFKTKRINNYIKVWKNIIIITVKNLYNKIKILKVIVNGINT